MCVFTKRKENLGRKTNWTGPDRDGNQASVVCVECK